MRWRHIENMLTGEKSTWPDWLMWIPGIYMWSLSVCIEAINKIEKRPALLECIRVNLMWRWYSTGIRFGVIEIRVYDDEKDIERDTD